MTKKIGNYHIFMFIFMLYFIPKYLEYTTFMKIDFIQNWIYIIKNISYILAFIYLFIKLIKKKKISASFLLTLTVILIYFSYQSFLLDRKGIFVVLLLSTIFDEQYLDKFIIAIFRISVIMYLITVISCKLGFIENIFTTRNKFGMEWTAGGTGFGYSGQMIMMLIPIIFMYYYKKRKHITLQDNIIWILIDIIVFMQCLTIMGFVLNLIFILLFNVLEYKLNRNKKILLKWKKIIYLPYVFTLLTLTLLLIYKNIPKIGIPLDILFNGRLNLGNIMINNYGVKLFGTNFVNNANNGFYEILDSEYVHMLVGEGIFYLIISLILCSFLLEYARKKKDYYLVLVWIIILFNAIFNNGIFNLVMNPFGIVLTISIRECIKCKHIIIKTVVQERKLGEL